VSHRASAAGLFFLSACSLTSLDGLSGNGTTNDGGALDGAPALDAGADAPPAEAVSSGGVVVATNVGVYWAGGGPQQHHIHYAEKTGAWVLFLVDGAAPDRIQTRVSADLASWTPGASLTLPHAHGGDGRCFDVAYRSAAADVFHVGVSLSDGETRSHYHARGRVQAGALSFDAPVHLGPSATASSSVVEPDAPSLTFLPNGKVLSTTGFITSGTSIGDFNVLVSKAADTGAELWSPDHEPFIKIESSPNFVNARALAPMPTGAFAAWERGDAEPTPNQLAYAVLNGTSWSSASVATFPNEPFPATDWGLAVTKDGIVHGVRWSGGTYRHVVRQDEAGRDGAPMPTAPHADRQGLVLLDVAGTITAFALTAQTGAIRRTRLVGDAWSSWEEIAPPDPGRRYLSGNVGGGRAVLLWTTVSNGASDLMAMRVP
jgi:hypothetical protein